MKKHVIEIILWANCQEGTKVWCKRKNDKHWILMKSPSWDKDNQYIVDGENAVLRMEDADASMV